MLKDSPLANELALTREEALKAEKFPLHVVMCSRCSHFQLKHIVSPHRLFSNYVYKSGTSRFFREHFKSLARAIYEFQDGNKLKVIEIGSNDGILLDEMSNLGISCVGIEPSQLLVSDCLDRGLDVIQGFLNEKLVIELKSSRGLFEVVIGNNVFAHIDDLLGAFKCVNQLLEPDGLFIFEVADFAQIRKKGIFDSIYHEHMSFHTATGLKSLAELSEFTIENFTYVDSHGGSFRFFLRKGLGKKQSKVIFKQIKKEASMRLNTPLVLNEIKDDIVKRRFAVNDFMQKRDKRSVLVGYGAPAKAVTFISEMGLENVGIMAILDDNLFKQGKFLPSSAIPVTSKDSLMQFLKESGVHETPIDFMIFPWNLGSEIFSKLKVWAPQNSKVITFFPDLLVIPL